MKLQKTVLAASLGLLVTAANAATYNASQLESVALSAANALQSSQVEADPNQKKETLEKITSDTTASILGGDFAVPLYDQNGNLTGYANHRYVWAPVAGAWNKNLNLDNHAADPYTNFADNHNVSHGGDLQDTITAVTGTGTVLGASSNIKHIDLGSKVLAGSGVSGTGLDYDVFKYTATNGTTQVYQFQDTVTGERTGYFTADNAGNLTVYTGSVDVNTLQKGGKIAGTTGDTYSTGVENKVVNSEHVLYGYQGQIATGNDTVGGFVVDETGTAQEPLQGVLKQGTTGTPNIKYVQTGIIANEYYKGQKDNGEWVYDPANNIYGVAAQVGNNHIQLTGNGLSLANVGNNGVLQFDGSVVSNAAVIDSRFSGVQKTREYNVSGTTYIEIYNDDEGRELASQWFTYVGGQLERATAPNVAAGSHIRTGVGVYNDGTWEVAATRRDVTNTKVSYGEDTSVQDKTVVQVGVTQQNGSAKDINGNFTNGPSEVVGSHFVDTGVIAVNAGKNIYGVQVKQTVKGQTDQVTTVTAAGIETTGVVKAAGIDAKTFKVDGVDVTEFLKTGVVSEGGVVGGVTETQVNTKVEAAKTEAVTTAVTEAKAYTDTKVEGAIKTASADVTATATKAAVAEATAQVEKLNKATLASAQSYTDAAVNKVSKRLDDVEKTANAGVAIALAAQQAVPNVQPGQVAVFGGVGHYEGETAVSLGAVTSFTDRISGSGAVGVADGSFGARVGISYLFGGK